MKTVLNVRLDSPLKKRLQMLSRQMGISLSALVSATLTKLVNEQKLELSGDLSASEIRDSFIELDTEDLNDNIIQSVKKSKQKNINEFVNT